MSPRPHHLRPLTALAALVSLAALAGCVQPVEFRSVGDARVGAYVKTPKDWTSDVMRSDENATLVGFWSPGLQTTRVVLAPTSTPSGMLVRQLATADQDLAILERNVFVSDLDAARASGAVTALRESSPVVAGQAVERREFQLTIENGKPVQLVQLTRSDADARTVSALVIGCSPDCMREHRDDIESVAASWTTRSP